MVTSWKTLRKSWDPSYCCIKHFFLQRAIIVKQAESRSVDPFQGIACLSSQWGPNMEHLKALTESFILIILSLTFLCILRTKEILYFRRTLAYLYINTWIEWLIRRLSFSVSNKVREDSDTMLLDALNHIIKVVGPFLLSPFESCRALAISLRQTPSVVFSPQPPELC